MSTKRLVARNLLWNWAGTFITMAAGFVVLPFMIDTLGDTIYGLWLQIAALTNFFGFLDLGIRGAVGRNIAFLRAKGDIRGINGVLNTALVLLFALGVVGILGILVYRAFFFDLFVVREDLREKVEWTLLIIAINLGLVLVFNAFDATLWGLQRFDIINLVDIPATVIRTLLVFYLIGEGRGLVTLACLTLALTCYAGLLKMWFSFRIEAGLRLAPELVSRDAGRQLFGYGLWYFLLSCSRLVNTTIGPQIVSNRLTSVAVTPLNTSILLIRTASAVMVAATGVLMPLATAFHARKERDHQTTLFVEGSKYCALIAFFFLGVFLFLGQPLLTLWLSQVPDARNWFWLLLILALGEVLPMTQMITWNVLLGMARHPRLALASLIENFVAIPASILLINHSEFVASAITFAGDQFDLSLSGMSSQAGLIGFCIAFAVPALICRGVFPAVFGCQILNVGFWHYARAVFLPTALIWLPSILCLCWLNIWNEPITWGRLILNAGVFGMVYVTLVCTFVIGWDRLIPLLRTQLDIKPSEPAI